jgi:multidrug transporter EmrE-like cation transporter
VLYAVISILTTSVLVGVVYYKETFNIYHWGALILSLITVVLFSLGEAKA